MSRRASAQGAPLSAPITSHKGALSLSLSLSLSFSLSRSRSLYLHPSLALWLARSLSCSLAYVQLTTLLETWGQSSFHFHDSLYFTIITISTVGYGDYVSLCVCMPARCSALCVHYFYILAAANYALYPTTLAVSHHNFGEDVHELHDPGLPGDDHGPGEQAGGAAEHCLPVRQGLVPRQEGRAHHCLRRHHSCQPWGLFPGG